MRAKSKIICLVLLVCSIGVVFSACVDDPYKDYVSSQLVPKTTLVAYSEQNFVKWNSDTKLKLLTSYTDYKNFGVDLGYTKGYFELNSLLIFLQSTCSSENHQFVDILEKDGKLYPVVEHNNIGPNDPVTDDIIYYAFYAEVSNSDNYKIGEVIFKTRLQNVMQ